MDAEEREFAIKEIGETWAPINKLLVLDGAFLKNQSKERFVLLGNFEQNDAWNTERALNNYIEFLADLDQGLCQGKLGERDEEYPYMAHASELDFPVDKYLRQADWQCPYLDWVIINCYITMEAISFIRDRKHQGLRGTLDTSVIG